MLGLTLAMFFFFVTILMPNTESLLHSETHNLELYLVIFSYAGLVLFLSIFFKKSKSILVFILTNIFSGIFLGLNHLLYPRKDVFMLLVVGMIIFASYHVLTLMLDRNLSYIPIVIGILGLIIFIFFHKLGAIIIIFGLFHYENTLMIKDSVNACSGYDLTEQTSLPYSLNLSMIFFSILLIILN